VSNAESTAAPIATVVATPTNSNRRAKFVAYPIGSRHGRALVNWVAEIRLAPGDRPLDTHDWRRTTDSHACSRTSAPGASTGSTSRR
jgi:hypothetical protein